WRNINSGIIMWIFWTELMSEDEWRLLGVQQSRGWIHYMVHPPEPHVLLFRRPKKFSNDPKVRMEVENSINSKREDIENAKPQ
ncbi:hypothetical protein SNEBB_007685, partial [Seison nebaliae]